MAENRTLFPIMSLIPTAIFWWSKVVLKHLADASEIPQRPRIIDKFYGLVNGMGHSEIYTVLNGKTKLVSIRHRANTLHSNVCLQL